MSLARRLACEFNLSALRGASPRLYMWTLTFPFFTRPKNCKESVRVFVQWLRRHGCNGVRVYENHKNGSLHIHIVLDRFLNVRSVREKWQGVGGGRIHVKFLQPEDNGQYIAKELCKSTQAAGFERGVRRYAVFGDAFKSLGKSLVNQIRFESADFCRFLLDRGENFLRVKGFSFGLEFFGVGYAAQAESTAGP